jgi:flagella basal body P-ring formation protein FlgA
MRCFRRSTRSFVSGVALLLTLTAGADARGGPDGRTPDATASVVSAALQAAARAHFGDAARVVVETVDGVRLEGPAENLAAEPVPGARIGRPSRFLLERRRRGAPVQRVGEATATIRVVASVVRTATALGRGARMDAGALLTVDVDLDGRPFRALPSLEECAEARVRRDLPAGAIVAQADILQEPLVRAGHGVQAQVRVGEVVVTGAMLAAENGVKGDVIRVVNEERRRVVRARVTGRNEVEVVDVP